MPLLLSADIFFGVGFGKGLPYRFGWRRCEIGGNQHAVSHKVLQGIQYAAFHLRQGFHFRLVGRVVLWLRSDLIRLNEENICSLDGERSIVDVAQTPGIRPKYAIGDGGPLGREFDGPMISRCAHYDCKTIRMSS